MGEASCVRNHKQPRLGHISKPPGSVRALRCPKRKLPIAPSRCLSVTHEYPPSFPPASLLACVWDEVFRWATPRRWPPPIMPAWWGFPSAASMLNLDLTVTHEECENNSSQNITDQSENPNNIPPVRQLDSLGGNASTSVLLPRPLQRALHSKAQGKVKTSEQIVSWRHVHWP